MNSPQAAATASPTVADLLASDLLQRLRTIGHSFCIAEGGSHGPDHSERVLHTALTIGERMGARLDILAPAALLHDIGRREESRSRGRICHARRGAELAAPLLRELAYGQAEIEAICHCIGSHRFRGAMQPATLEAKILYDADKLDSIGAVGIGRAFLFAGQIGARLHNPELDPAATSSYSLEDTAYREFRIKMSRVRTRMLTSVGRDMAEQRHAFMQIFFDQLTWETNGILP
ncbi:HD domain-containing protein [Desulfobulbus sp.]|uniref:HD domain-containing protein n=1 Tax=Desulfobulbus sp. TaxID=895 RepID=UPI00286F6283|nr:HD domain-containing protein [Desulfobulbus sp.]